MSRSASIQARLGFVEPLLTAEAFSTVIASLIAKVCGDLERAGQGARRLDLLFERVDGSVQAIRIGTARPVRDARHLGRMLDERLERVDPGLGVEAMRLVVPRPMPWVSCRPRSSLVAEASPDWPRWWIGWPIGWARRRCIASRRWKVTCRNDRCVEVPASVAASRARRLAGGSAAAGAAARSAAAGRCDGAAAGSSAGGLHLAAGASPGAPRRWAGTHRRGVVEARPGMGVGARLFPGGGRRRPPFLAVPARQWRAMRRPAICAGSCTGCFRSRDHGGDSVSLQTLRLTAWRMPDAFMAILSA